MKFTKIIKKNLKLLIRAKGSAFIVIFGPLLIILLVGLALNKPSTYALSIGYYTPDSNNSLTNSFINEMKLNNYLVAKYGSEELCIDEIKKGSTHLCIIFPKDFELGKNESNNVVFYADYSRTNLVYQIIGSISEKFEFRTTEISKDLTQVLLTKILKTKQDVDENILTIINMKSAANTISSSIEDTKKASSDIDFTSQDISLKDIKTAGGDIFSDAKDLKSEGLDAVVEGQTFADSLGNISATDFKNSLTSIQTSINQIYNNTPENLDNFNQLIDNATAKITILKTKLVDGSKKNKEVITKLDSIKTALENLKKDSDALKIKLESINANLEKLDVSTAEDIVSPIRTEIRPIISESNQLVFMFPYLLTLVIMFIGIMLSSSLIMMEKSSKAFFRNFTTPTKEEFFLCIT